MNCFNRQLGLSSSSTQVITEIRKENPSMLDRQARVTCIKLTKIPTLTKNSGQPRSRSALDRLTGQDLPCANHNCKSLSKVYRITRTIKNSRRGKKKPESSTPPVTTKIPQADIRTGSRRYADCSHNPLIKAVGHEPPFRSQQASRIRGDPPAVYLFQQA